MTPPPLRHRLQGLFWEHNTPARRFLRRLRTQGSLMLHRARRFAGRAVGTRVVPAPAARSGTPIRHPAVSLVDRGGPVAAETTNQTESSITSDPADFTTPTYIAHTDGIDRLPAVHLEAMLMAAAAEDLSWTAGGWSPPATGRFGPSGEVLCDKSAPAATHLLVRSPSVTETSATTVTGRAVPHITAAGSCVDLAPLVPHTVSAGPHRLRPDASLPATVSCPTYRVDEALADLPAVDGPPTVLFLLPYLAIGGAERLLFELMEGLAGRYRLIVATTDPHLESLGQTVDRARELTPHVYTLGDWLPREAAPSALRHLIRRWQVESLVCWNGSVLFYDEAVALREAFPGLRILNQLFNHRGGWIEHYSPSLDRVVDTHIAVNTPIARALSAERGVADDRIATIHHAVGVPDPRDETRRAELRNRLGAADDTMVVGTFIRMHPQKRPLDVIGLARLLTDENIHFLLIGGGPMDEAVDRSIASDPPPNLTRLPLQPDATAFYDAIDLCLMTSDFEGLPVFLLDGLARGIPAVATAVGDIPLLLEMGGGRVVERPGDLDGLAAAIRSYLDPDKRRNDGDTGRRSVAANFGLDRYVAAYESVIFPPA